MKKANEVCIYEVVKSLAAFYESGTALKTINVTPTNIKNSSEKGCCRTRSALIPLEQVDTGMFYRATCAFLINHIATIDNTVNCI